MSRWITQNATRSSAPFRLFCFPYAGGSSTIYREWQAAVPAEIGVCAVNLPGRGSRFDEPLHHDMAALTEALADGLAPAFDRPFAFFGHSLGAMIAFDLARTLRRRGGPMPRHLFLSGRPGPELAVRSRIEPPLEDEELVEMLSALNGTSRDALANKDLVALMLPMLRADMTIVQTHCYGLEAPLACGITAFGGDADPTVGKVGLMRWRAQTTGAFRLHVIEGDHFFLNSNRAPILDVVRDTLQLVGGPPGDRGAAADSARARV